MQSLETSKRDTARRWARYLALVVLTGVIALAAFGVGFYSGHTRDDIARFALSAVTLLSGTKDQLAQAASGTPIHVLEPGRHEGDGVTVNRVDRRDELVLLSGFFDDTNGLWLMTRDGDLLARWDVAFSRYFSKEHVRHPPASDWACPAP